MNRIYLRIIAAMLASLMLLLAVACSEPKEPVETTDEVSDESTSGEETTDETTTDGETTGEVTTGEVTTGEETTGEETTEGATSMETGVTTDSSQGTSAELKIGKKVTVLYWSDCSMPEFNEEEPSVNCVENAVYQRNQQTVNALGLTKLSWVGIPGNHGQKEEFTEHVGNVYKAGDRKYDIIATYSRTAGHCMIEGYFADLASIENSCINFEQPWWPKTLVDTVTVNDALYFLSGDISTNTIYMMHVMFCNLDLQKALKLEDPVQLTLEKKWTLERFMKMSEGVFLEQNGDGKPSVGDRFGFVTEQLHVDAFYHGSGLMLIESDPDDGLVISNDFFSTKLSNLITSLSDFFGSYNTQIGSSGTSFQAKNALFVQDRLLYAEQKLLMADFEYACLPTPMYDEKQGGYITNVANLCTLWGIMRDVPSNPEERPTLVESTAVLELLACYSFYGTTPQICENSIKLCYCSNHHNQNKIACFALIREGIIFDFGRIFPNTEMGDYMNETVSRVIAKRISWINERAHYLVMYRTNLKATVAKLKKNTE